jgi:hypothetical protein
MSSRPNAAPSRAGVCTSAVGYASSPTSRDRDEEAAARRCDQQRRMTRSGKIDDGARAARSLAPPGPRALGPPGCPLPVAAPPHTAVDLTRLRRGVSSAWIRRSVNPGCLRCVYGLSDQPSCEGGRSVAEATLFALGIGCQGGRTGSRRHRELSTRSQGHMTVSNQGYKIRPLISVCG